MSDNNICHRTGLPHSYWPQGNCQYCGEVSPVLASTSEELNRLRDENERLKANIDRLTSNPTDHRYWEGRYRDEVNENDKLKEAIIEACDLLMERKQGSPSRSPSHNARLRLEEASGHWNGRALSPYSSTQKEG